MAVSELVRDEKSVSDIDSDCVYDCCEMETSRTSKATVITPIYTRKTTATTVAFILLLILCCLCDYNYGSMTRSSINFLAFFYCVFLYRKLIFFKWVLVLFLLEK